MLNVILPVLLLAMAILMRLVVLRLPSPVERIEAYCEVPVDLIFLCLSFVMAFTISDIENRDAGLTFITTGIVVAMIVATGRRLSVNAISKGGTKWRNWFIPNFILALLCLFFSIYLLTGKLDTSFIDGSDKDQNPIEKVDK